MQNGDGPAGHDPLLKMLKTHLLKFFCKHIFQHCLDTSLQNVDEALSSISLVGRDQLMKCS